MSTLMMRESTRMVQSVRVFVALKQQYPAFHSPFAFSMYCLRCFIGFSYTQFFGTFICSSLLLAPPTLKGQVIKERGFGMIQ